MCQGKALLITPAPSQTHKTSEATVRCSPVQVLTTLCCRGSRMRVNPTLVKQYARQVAPLGMVLWRQVVAAGSTAGGSSSSSSGATRLTLAPAQIKQQLATFAAQGDANKQFVQLPDNRNLPSHLGVPPGRATVCALLTCHDDPLTISGSELTGRWHWKGWKSKHKCVP